MRRLKEKFKNKNSDLIKSFLQLQGHPENYEVWAPYVYHGIIGFVDLVIESRSEISLFKFARDSKSIEEDVKGLKLESSIYPKSRSVASKDVNSYLVIADNRKNRKMVLSQKRLLEEQPLEILFLNEEEGRIESIFELRYDTPRLFQAESLRIEDKALNDLISRPDHSRIERALLNLEDSPEVITKGLVQKTSRYLKRNDESPDDISSLKGTSRNRRAKSYETGAEKNGMKEAKQAKGNH